MENNVKIFAGSGSRELADKIAKAYGQEVGSMVSRKFSDGEWWVSYEESIRGSNMYLIQSTCPPADNIMELLLMIDAAKRASARWITVVIPYFGYARQDRKDRPRVSIAAKLLATRIVTCDLHAGQIQGFFDIPLDHLSASAIFVPYIRNLDIKPTFAAPDMGGVTRTRAFAEHFHANMVICDKHRKRANEIAAMQVIGDVNGADIVIVDDIIDTGGTLCKAAEMLMDKGAKSVRAVCTHALLSGKAYENITASRLEQVIVTDTIPMRQSHPKITVLSVAEMFANAIHKVNSNESISTLFI
jgi:ribose-phosphate pyrophosphokinase